MAYSAGERKDVRKAEKEARLAEQQRREIISGIMSVMPGRRWILEKLEECHIFATSYSRDPITMAYSEGERSIGLKLLNDIMASCPDAYVLMMKERNERDAARRTTDERPGSPNGNGSAEGPTDTADSTAGDEATDDGGEPAGTAEVAGRNEVNYAAFEAARRRQDTPQR